jgi:hypothetical protein
LASKFHEEFIRSIGFMGGVYGSFYIVGLEDRKIL